MRIEASLRDKRLNGPRQSSIVLPLLLAEVRGVHCGAGGRRGVEGLVAGVWARLTAREMRRHFIRC